MAYDYRRLCGKIAECCGTQATFAQKMDLSERSISLKLNNKVPFSQVEIDKAIDVLGIAKEDICAYFFARKVQ